MHTKNHTSQQYATGKNKNKNVSKNDQIINRYKPPTISTVNLSVCENIWLFCQLVNEQLGKSKNIIDCELKFRILIVLILTTFEYEKINKYNRFLYKLITKIKNFKWSYVQVLKDIEEFELKHKIKLETFIIPATCNFEFNHNFSIVRTCFKGELSNNLLDLNSYLSPQPQPPPPTHL